MSSVLYDAPGPKARKRARTAGVVGGALLLALLGLALWRLASNEVFEADRWTFLVEEPATWEALGRGLLATLRAAAVATVVSFAIAVLLASFASAPLRAVRVLTRVYVEVFRGLPVLLMMLFAVIGFGVSIFNGVVIGLVLYNSAVFAEIIRAGVVSLPKGQREAGLAVGLTQAQAFRIIELPQALRRMAPSLVSQVVVLLKDTSLGYAVGYAELLRTNRNLAQFFGSDSVFTLFFVTAAIYLLVNFSISRLSVWIERRGARARARQADDGDDSDYDPNAARGLNTGAST